MTGIFNHIVENVDGGTIALIGDAWSTEVPEDGYFVGGASDTLILSGTPGLTDRPVIEAFVDGLTTGYVGWWIDTDTGKFYVDGSTWHAEYDVAESACRRRGEIAFWDIERGREFRPVEQWITKESHPASGFAVQYDTLDREPSIARVIQPNGEEIIRSSDIGLMHDLFVLNMNNWVDSQV